MTSAIVSQKKKRSRRKSIDPDTAAASISPKVAWSSAASALAVVVWTLVASLAPTAFTPSSVATLTGSTATLLVFVGGYFAKDTLRHRP
ncbi:hypothetical protein GCM10023094_05830 [Rhodococcus olei]|uniref:Uncharacterized protein n=1 Tax=Rhodococcus olei TaxID=2161675 RepID=A0ABP8NTF2_9NOCA